MTDEHLLQFAACIGEEAAAAAAAQLALPLAWEHPGCLLGAADGGAAGCSDERWEQVRERLAITGLGGLRARTGVVQHRRRCHDLPCAAGYCALTKPASLCLPVTSSQVVSQSEGGLTYEVWRQSLRGEPSNPSSCPLLIGANLPLFSLLAWGV